MGRHAAGVTGVSAWHWRQSARLEPTLLISRPSWVRWELVPWRGSEATVDARIGGLRFGLRPRRGGYLGRDLSRVELVRLRSVRGGRVCRFSPSGSIITICQIHGACSDG